MNACELLLTPEAVAAKLSLKVQSLAAWRCRGEGPAYIHVGRAVRYPADALDKWLSAQTVTPGGEPQQ